MKGFNHFIYNIVCFLPLLLVFSCSSTRYLSEDEYLLSKNKIEDVTSDIPDDEYKNYIKQKPNKTILGWRFWLSVYNLSGEDVQKWINRYLRRVGESPVAYDEDLRDNTAQQLELFLFNKGYFNAEVDDTTYFKNRKAKVEYNINAGRPYSIRNIDYFFEDASLSKLVMSDSIPSLLEPGMHYDTDVLQAERNRIERILRDRGYYNFSSGFVYYEADSTIGNQQVDIVLGIRNYPRKDKNGRITQTQHSKYRIREVVLKANSPGNSLHSIENLTYFDTAYFEGIKILRDSGTKIKPRFLVQKNYIFPGDLYSSRREQQTYRNLNSLSAFSFVDLSYMEVPGDEPLLDCEINLFPAVRQAFTGGLEGTTSGGNIGAAGNLNYQHRNLFGGSERFDITLHGAIESLSENPEIEYQQLGTMQEVGAEAKITLPKFLLPFRSLQFVRRYNPKTSFNISYNYQRRPDYARSTLKGSYGYQWRGNRYLSHAIYPLEISLINTPFLRGDFRDLIEGTYLYYSYLPHFITNQRYWFVFTNQNINKQEDFQYLRFEIETAGNLMYAAYKLIGQPANDAVLKVFGVDYAQYFRTNVDVRDYNYFGENSTLVFRFFAGTAIPYLNSTAIPFEKQYFGGGANSIRAYKVKNLGPGSFKGDSLAVYPNQTADLKIEGNVEYRFNLFWKIDGALFVDAGNIWSLSKEDDREGALFELNRFYKEFAVGTGFGFRFDFNFFVFRFDLGIPLVDPRLPEGQRWVPGNMDIDYRDLGYNIAIGYPF